MIPEYRDDWKLLEARPPDSKEIWMFRKNIGVSEIRGLKELPTLVYFTIQYHPKDETGLPTAFDTKVLYDFEEGDIPAIEAAIQCVYVASVIKGGVKDHLFYVADPDVFVEAVSSRAAVLEPFEISLERHDDPKWKIYEDFPGD